MANTNPAHIVLTGVRLSYVHLDQPYSQNGGEPKFSAVILVPKQPGDNYAKIMAAIQAATAKAREKFGQAFPVQPKNSVHDGDGARPSDGQPFGEECRGCWVFTASNKTRPRVVDGNIQPILDSTEIYSGMYANVGVTFFGYSAPQNKGIGVALDNVQKIGDGEPLGGGRVSAEDDFAPLAQPAAQTPAVYPGQAPAAYLGQAAHSQPAAAYPAQTPPAVYPGQPTFNAPAVDPFTGLPW